MTSPALPTEPPSGTPDANRVTGLDSRIAEALADRQRRILGIADKLAMASESQLKGIERLLGLRPRQAPRRLAWWARWPTLLALNGLLTASVWWYSFETPSLRAMAYILATISVLGAGIQGWIEHDKRKKGWMV